MTLDQKCPFCGFEQSDLHQCHGLKRKHERQCPWYKRIPNTTFTMDAFNYGSIDNCSAYFLSHFHADHYIGLKKSWTNGPIYCSKITRNLVLSKIKPDPNIIISLPVNEPVQIENALVTLIDANQYCLLIQLSWRLYFLVSD